VNGIDVLVIVILGLCAWSGARRGWRLSLLDLACIVLGIVVGIYTYPAGVWVLRKLLGLPYLLAGPLGFMLMVLLGGALIWLGGMRWLASRDKRAGRSGDRKKASDDPAEGAPARTLGDRLGGGIIGAFMGAMGMTAFLMLVGMGSTSKGQIQHSALARSSRSAIPIGLEMAEHLGVDLPRVVVVPKSLTNAFEFSPMRVPRFIPINFTKLDGSKCIKCGGKVRFLGYKWKDLPTPCPKFQCTVCGRTSDGCQTFEGFHKMYGDCPFTLADQGALLDCGVWTNGDPVVPQGRCPVCGRELHLREPEFASRPTCTVPL
jgi:hypothetical protein